jgi:hypothetical protein
MLPGDQRRVNSEVKAASEITCGYVWDKLYPLISITCSKRYIRIAPYVLRAQLLDLSLLSHHQLA